MADIVYIQYTNPAAYPPLQHSSRIFAKAGKKVLFLGTGSAGKSDKFEFPAHENIKVIRWRFCPPGFFQKIHFLTFSVWASLKARMIGAKWIYASDMFSCPAALIAQKVFGLKFIYHEHDSPNLNSDKKTLVEKFQLYLRKIIGKSAEIVIFPNEARANLFREETGRTDPIQIVWNVPSLDEINLCHNSKPLDTTLFYHGSLNEKRLPTSVLDALLILDSNIELIFAGYTAGISYDYGEWYLSEAKKRGLEKRVKYIGSFSRFELLKKCNESTIGLAFMPLDANDINMKYMIGASNKPFDYLACGLQLVVSDLPDWLNLYVDLGLGHCCDPENPISIAQAINKIVDCDSNKLDFSNKVKHKLTTEWNYERQFAKIFEQVAK